MAIFIFLFFIQGLTSVVELTPRNFETFVDEYSYLIITFNKGHDCKKCIEFESQFDQISKNFRDKILGFGKVNCTQYPVFIKRFGINKYPAIIFFRQGDVEVYEGQKTYKALLNWLQENLRPLVNIIEDSEDLKNFLADKVALVYYTKVNEFIDPYILMKMKEVNQKYSQLYMVLAKSPDLRIQFGIDDDTYLVIYPQEGEPKKYKGYIQDMENYLIEKSLPLIYTGTNLEMEVLQKKQIPFFLIFDEINEEYWEIAEMNQYFVRLIVLPKTDNEAVIFFSQLFEQSVDISKIYFYETKKKETTIISKLEIKHTIWDYIDREDGVKIDI